MTLDESGWRPSDAAPNLATGERYEETDAVDVLRGAVPVHLPQGEFGVRVTEFQDARRPDQRLLGGYLFVANGRTTPSAIAVRSLAFERTHRHAYYCKVQFNMPAKASDVDRLEVFADRSSDLFSHLLPHLMRCLPDWPEVESSNSGAAVAEGASRAEPGA